MRQTLLLWVCAWLAAPIQTSLEQQEAARDTWQRVPAIVDALNIRAGSTVADVGAGNGYLTVRLAEVVGASGHVYAIESNPLTATKLVARVGRLTNVSVHRAAAADVPVTNLDAVVLLNTWSVLGREAIPTMEWARRAIRVGGRLVIVDHAQDMSEVGRRELSIVRASERTRFAVVKTERFTTMPYIIVTVTRRTR